VSSSGAGKLGKNRTKPNNVGETGSLATRHSRATPFDFGFGFLSLPSCGK
jgi:hypothetical protein